MHHIYHTEGIILGSRNFRESDKYYQIFTRDLGMLTASASGVRKMSSKLRFILQDFAYIVQGRNIFRITSASKTGLLEQIVKKPEQFRVFANISRLLRRLLAGVEPNESLYADVIQGLSMLEKVETEEDIRNIEAVIVLRMVHNLGYIGGDDMLKEFIKSPFEEDIIFEAAKNRTKILAEINKALKETHL
jgi:DNA repair protein RecO (recombination protein O)